jgi:hypothetical protein
MGNRREQPQSLDDIARAMPQETRTALYNALSHYVVATPAMPMSREQFSMAFASLDQKDRMSFIKDIQEGIAITERIRQENEVDAAWQKAAADAKAQREAISLWP